MWVHEAGESAGVKSVEMQIEGQYAYGYLAGEKGTHRIVRISPFSPGTSSQRHTSFAAVEVMPVLGACTLQACRAATACTHDGRRASLQAHIQAQ